MLNTTKTHFVLPGGEDDSHQIISPFEDKKIFLSAVCAVCHVKGMAYMDPKEKENKLHYCYKHPHGKGAKN